MKYPVVCLKEDDNMIYGFKDEDSLTIASKKLVDRGVFTNVNIVDSNGEILKIKKVKELGWGTSFFGYSFKRNGRYIKIDFETELLKIISLEEFKKDIVNRLVKSKYFNEAFSIPDVIKFIQNSSTIKDVISFFSGN